MNYNSDQKLTHHHTHTTSLPDFTSAAQHDEVSDWIRHHASKFFQSLSTDPAQRNHALSQLVQEARLYDLSRGDVLCVQNEVTKPFQFIHLT